VRNQCNQSDKYPLFLKKTDHQPSYIFWEQCTRTIELIVKKRETKKKKKKGQLLKMQYSASHATSIISLLLNEHKSVEGNWSSSFLSLIRGDKKMEIF